MRKAIKRLALQVSQTGNFDLLSVGDRLRRIGGPYTEVSGLFTAHDDPGRPSRRLLSLTARLAAECPKVELRALRSRGAPPIVHTWPGEHYRLLAALARIERPQVVVEIGTLTGFSAIAILEELAPEARLTTFDLLRWPDIPGTVLAEQDFESGRLTQEIADLGAGPISTRYATLLRSADVIFADASKDGTFERRFLANLAEIGLKDGALVVLDDIRLWNMLAVWRDIDRPKIDLTSLGHYSGTGIIDWTGTSETA
jgi:predicted O-methyltransferase YrrM